MNGSFGFRSWTGDFLIALAGLLSAKLRFSVVPFYILVGMAVGPHAFHFGSFDFRFIESAPFIDFMGRIGVLFLLFYLGLEFSVGRLIKSGKSIVVGGSIYIAINFTLGLMIRIFPVSRGGNTHCCGNNHLPQARS